jgi:hypothetical protein
MVEKTKKKGFWSIRLNYKRCVENELRKRSKKKIYLQQGKHASLDRSFLVEFGTSIL